jgi:glycosyltransferase involved in cell wall biosynthesis
VSFDVAMGFYFFPRGGSAQVTRSLCRALADRRLAPTLLTGSIGPHRDMSNAGRFFSGIRCESLDYTAARTDWAAGLDSMSGTVPMHGSYEDKIGVPDRIFFELDDDAFDRQVCSWQKFIGASIGQRPDVVHLHHLTPMHEAVHALWPDIPVVTHLHGTELKMLDDAEHHGSGHRGTWTRQWVDRMRRWAGDSDRIAVVSAQDHRLARQLLPVDASRISTIANGVDAEIFSPRIRRPVERPALWRRWLIDDPRGWKPGGCAGSIRYDVDQLSAFTDCDGQPVPVVLFAGRFLRFKRLQLLIEAHHAMRATSLRPSVLVIVGGFPGEWEGEHPYDTVQRLGAQGVFLAGWRDHDELAEILNCSDVFAAPSVDEPFGLVYLEAMAAGLPPIATNTGGPLSFINIDPDLPTGWLVPPDDVTATAAALTEAVSNRSVRLDRGRRAAAFVRQRYSWDSAAEAFARLYREVADEHDASRTLSQSGR